MTNIIKRSKPLSVSPLKASQTLGAVLAFLGVDRAIPLMHGAQGCTAFSKIFFTRHFRDPIPVQTTAMDQISAVMGADENIVEGSAGGVQQTAAEPHRTADNGPRGNPGSRRSSSRQAVPRVSSRVQPGPHRAGQHA